MRAQASVAARLQACRCRRPRGQRLQAAELRWPGPRSRPDALAEAELQAHPNRAHVCRSPGWPLSLQPGEPRRYRAPAGAARCPAGPGHAGRGRGCRRVPESQPSARALSQAQGDARDHCAARQAPPEKSCSKGRFLTYSRKHQMEDARVPQLREQLGLTGEDPDLRYDAKLSEAVKNSSEHTACPRRATSICRTVRD